MRSPESFGSCAAPKAATRARRKRPAEARAPRDRPEIATGCPDRLAGWDEARLWRTLPSGGPRRPLRRATVAGRSLGPPAHRQRRCDQRWPARPTSSRERQHDASATLRPSDRGRSVGAAAADRSRRGMEPWVLDVYLRARPRRRQRQLMAAITRGPCAARLPYEYRRSRRLHHLDLARRREAPAPRADGAANFLRVRHRGKSAGEIRSHSRTRPRCAR